MDLEVVERNRWNDVLAEANVADLYLLLEHLDVSSMLDNGVPVLLHLRGEAGGHVVFPLLLRDIPEATGFRDVVTPYGYGGPVASGPGAPLAGFHGAYSSWCRDNHVITSFLRFHPLYGNHRYAHPECAVTPLAGTVGMQLLGGHDLLASMHGKHRNVVRKAMAAGVEVTVREAPADLDNFIHLYELTMRRATAPRFYFFSSHYWTALQGTLRDHLVLFEAHLDGELAAASLCLASKPWLHYHLGATSDVGRSVGASNLVLYTAALWAQRRDFERFHLGGGVGGGDDQLFRFKRRFDETGLLESAVGKIIHDVDLYRGLTGSVSSSGYFPAYRARPPDVNIDR